ncbi:uncharacterized protein LOC107508969 isoform X2 [Rousettus aegyptiacus]|uniref:Uncharacterized protein n=1 Tax=Rousettus aegyptiacus TaxID=9407 RepID=A0A7J8BE57_ROUAE|nr:uncharacterized protein LOC107508969 isoform X2 [Rousettus aegyptiacus]KAF6396998.1 hypothetical protein HJG63_009684 [Rousettus aegyptiacus]
MAPPAAAAHPETGSCGRMKEIEVKRGASSLGSCVCQLLLNTSEKLCFQLKGTTCPENLSTWDKNPLSGSLVKMNWTNCMFQDSRASNAFLDNSIPLFCSENITTLNPETTPKELSSLGTAATAISGSIGVVALILLLVGLLSMTLKKWRHERLFKKQLRHQNNFLYKSSLSCHADAIYANVINLATWKEDDFAVYANVPPFDHPRRPSPDQVEYASIVFH